MSGRKQHYIPQLLLRGFEAPSAGRTKKVWVFTRRKSFLSPIKDVAAERHFYSEPAKSEAETLDDTITQYENMLSELVLSLRQIAVGSEVAAEHAAEIVSHLTIRNAALRTSFTGAMRDVIDQAGNLFCTEAFLRKRLGVDDNQLPTCIVAIVDEQVAQHAGLSQLGLPGPVLHKMAYMALKENFSGIIAENLPIFRAALQHLSAETPKHVRLGHNKALAATNSPDARVAALRSLHWSIHAAPQEGAVLPDCVAFGMEGKEAPKPLILSDLEGLIHAFMPLSTNRILVGSRAKEHAADLTKFNCDAARCSESFFLASRPGSDLNDLAQHIGELSKATLDEAIQSAFEAFRPGRELPAASPAATEHELCAQPTDITPTAEKEGLQSNPGYAITFKGVSDEETASKIAGILQEIVQELRPMMPLDRLDGFTFAEDYDSALAELDRGVSSWPKLQATKEYYGEGVAMTPAVWRDGMLKHHVIANMWVAYGLVSPDETLQQLSTHTLIHQLAYVACTHLVEESLPGTSTTPLKDPYDLLIYPYADRAWRSYFAARASAAFDPTLGDAYAQLILGALDKAGAVILPARLAYRFDGNLDRLLALALPLLATLLDHLAHLLGHVDGLGEPFEKYAVASVFNKAGLRGWVELLQKDLQLLWKNSGQWKSMEEFLVLNNHFEKLLWQVGLFPWKTADGQVRIEVPLITDAVHLAG